MPKDLVELGSATAKGGFRNEDDVVRKFNNWDKDGDAQRWLEAMGYKLKEIEKVLAMKIHGYKTDVQVQITIIMKMAISAENLSVKLISNPCGYNQVDKRWVDKYKEMWSMPDDVAVLLKLYTGETPHKREMVRDMRRLFFDEMTVEQRKKVAAFFEKNKILIISDILKGRGKLSADWMLVVLKSRKRTAWVLRDMNKAMNIFGNGDVKFTEKGSMKIGKITMQRKGGDAGRDTAKMLQFKINPANIFWVISMDTISKEKRSEVMSKIRSSRTKPELKIKRLMNVMGFSYHEKGIYGKPDFACQRTKTAVFIDGCFWHGCRLHLRLPKTNRAYWISKIRRNAERDKQVTLRLKSEGWRVVRIWEHDLRHIK